MIRPILAPRPEPAGAGRPRAPESRRGQAESRRSSPRNRRRRSAKARSGRLAKAAGVHAQERRAASAASIVTRWAWSDSGVGVDCMGRRDAIQTAMTAISLTSAILAASCRLGPASSRTTPRRA
eukprot:8698723-Alexandrium_andersonii.AAC.1